MSGIASIVGAGIFGASLAYRLARDGWKVTLYERHEPAHLGAASGSLETVLCILALLHGQVPPTLNYEHPDPQCPIHVIHGRPLSLDEFLDVIEFFDLGGTCHSCNPFMAGLLKSLDYDADLLGADMTDPDVHTCVRVRLNGAEYHVDLGYAAPFRSPICLDPLPHESAEGESRYIVDRRIGFTPVSKPIDRFLEAGPLDQSRIIGWIVNGQNVGI